MSKLKIIILICTVSMLAIYGIFSLAISDTSAKYTNYKEMNHFYESNKIYISSDSLIESDGKYNIINYYNFEPIIIKINNSISENQITNYDIEYELKCMVKGDASNYYNCLFDDEENQIIDSLNKEGKCIEDESLLYDECVLSEYTYELVSVFNEHNFKINKLKQNTYEKIEVEVVLTTTSPFSKSLKAIYVFNFGDKNNNSINVDKVKDLESYCEYTINNNYNNKKTIKINIDTDKMLFDTTDNIISYTNTDEGIVNSITIEINKHGNRMIRLYKKDFDSECNVNSFNYSIVE